MDKVNMQTIDFTLLMKATDIPGYILRAVYEIRSNKGFLNTGKFLENMSLDELQDVLDKASHLNENTDCTKYIKPLIVFAMVIAYGEGLPGIEEHKVKEVVLTLILLTMLTKFHKLKLGVADFSKFELMSTDSKAILFVPNSPTPDNPHEADQPT